MDQAPFDYGEAAGAGPLFCFKGRGLAGQPFANLIRLCDVDGIAAFVDVLNDAFLVDHKGCAIGEAAFLIQDAVELRDLALEIAEQGIGNPNIFSKTLVCILAVDADS